MRTRTVELELMDSTGEYTILEVDVNWSFSQDDYELYVENLEQIVTNFNPSGAIGNIQLAQLQIEAMCFLLPEWTQEEAEDAADTKGDAEYEECKLRGM